MAPGRAVAKSNVEVQKSREKFGGCLEKYYLCWRVMSNSHKQLLSKSLKLWKSKSFLESTP